jgi:SAM-dependent methyltransferase
VGEIAHRGLIRLFAGALRQGPGDPAVLDRMVSALDPPDAPRAADFGCGAGGAALRLAERWAADVIALDCSAAFIAALAARCATAPPSRGRVRPAVGDMAAPPIEAGSLDLIVSESSAYAIGFASALTAWRRLLAPGGGVVVSECVWLGAERPDAAAYFWGREYPAMGTTAEAVAAAEAAGLRLVASERLPASAWLSSYYAPLAAHMATLEAEARADHALAAAMAEMRREIESFSSWSHAVGYCYFAFDAAA